MNGAHPCRWRALAPWMLGCSLWACDLDGSPLYFPWPDGHAGACILMDLDDPPLARAAEGRDPVVLSGLSGVDLYAVEYDESLAELDLSPGELRLGDACNACELLQPKATFRLHGDPPAWESLPDLPGPVGHQLVPDADPRCNVACPPWTKSLEAAPWSAPVVFSVPLDPGLIIGTMDGRLYRLDEEARAEPLCSTPIFELQSAALRGPTELWVAEGAGAQLLTMDLEAQSPDLPCVTVPVTNLPAQLAAFAVSPPQSPIELVASTNDHGILHFDGQGWTQLATIASTPAQGRGAVWMGERRFAATFNSTQLAIVENGVAMVEELPPGVSSVNPTMATALGWHRDLGLLVGADGLGLVRWRDRSTLVANDGSVGGLVVGNGQVAVLDRLGSPARYDVASGASCAPVESSGDRKSRHGMWLPDGSLYLADALEIAPGREKTAARFLVTDLCRSAP